MDDEERDLVYWTRSRGGVDLDTLARWHDTDRVAIMSCLPIPEFLDAWDELTPDERSALTSILIRKKNAYLGRVRAMFTPAELARNRTYQRLLRMFPI